MLTIILVCPADRLPTRYRQVANRSPTVGRLLADSWPILWPQTKHKLLADNWPSVGQLLADCRPTVDPQSADSWPTVGRLLPNSRPTVAQLLADCWPTVNFGNYSSLLPWVRKNKLRKRGTEGTGEQANCGYRGTEGQ